METREYIVLRKKDTGLYLSDTPERHSKKLWDAKPFYDMEHLEVWLGASVYAPEYPEMYERLVMETTKRLKEVDHE